MEVLERKFDLPPSKAETRDLQREERINAVKPQESGKIKNVFEDLNEIDVKNKITKPTSPVKKKPDELPAKKVDAKKKAVEEENPEETPSTDDSKVTPDQEEAKPSKLPQFQFRRLDAIPDNLVNMPIGSGEIEMMAQGEGIKGLLPFETIDEANAWVKAWKFLDEYDADDTYYSYELRKGLVRQADGHIFAHTFASTSDGIQRYRNGEWTKIRDLAAASQIPRLHILDNDLHMVNNNVTTGSPVDKYNLSDDSWEKYSGDIPLATGDWVEKGIVHNGEIYVASSKYVWKKVDEPTPSWVKFYDGLIEGSLSVPGALIDDITSDGTDLYVVGNIIYDDTTKATNIYKITDTAATKIAKLDNARQPGSSLDYESHTGKLYAGLLTDPSKIYRSTLEGDIDLLLTLDDKYPYNGAVAGEKYGYLSAGKKLYRLGDDEPTEIHGAATDQKYITRYDEQILVGDKARIFHSEWEGYAGLKTTTKPRESKFGL